MSWNTKRDGYYSAPAPNPLGRPVPKLEPHAGVTHAVIIRGTSFKCFLDDSYMQEHNGKPARVHKLLRDLSRTATGKVGRRTVKAVPELLTIAEFQQLNSNSKAA